MAEEGRPRPWVLPRLNWATVLRLSPLLLLLSFAIGYFICYIQFRRPQQTQLEPLEVRGGKKGKEGREALGCSGGDPTGAGRMHLEDAPERKQRSRKRGKIGTK